jgi:hypothetical protein
MSGLGFVSGDVGKNTEKYREVQSVTEVNKRKLSYKHDTDDTV